MKTLQLLKHALATCTPVRFMHISHFTQPVGEHQQVVSTYGNWTFVHPQDTIEEDARAAFLNVSYEAGAFVGMCLHLMQQCGGELYHRVTRVAAVRLQDTAISGCAKS